MLRRALLACLLVTACGAHRQPTDPRGPQMSPDWRCTLRISQRGTFVDGDRVSRADAVAYCKRAPGGAVVVVEENPTQKWDSTMDAMVTLEDRSTKAEWDQTRSALEREGVRIYVRGELCYDPQPLGCRPQLPSKSMPGTERVRKTEPLVRRAPPEPTK